MEDKRPVAQTKTRRSRRNGASSYESSTRAAGATAAGMLSQAFIELAPDAMLVIDSAGRILQVNQQVEALFGYGRPTLLGRPVETLIPDRFHAIHPQHRTEYASNPHTRPMGVNLPLFGRRQDGSEFPVEVSLSPFQFGDDLLVICSIRDITARRRLEEEHAVATEQLQLQADLIEHAHDAIIVRDLDGRIRSWNRGAEAIYGWTEQDVLGQVTHTFLQTQFPENLGAIEAQLTRDGQWEGELTHSTRDGRQVVVESRQVLAQRGQQRQSVILEINRNITQRKRLEAAELDAHRAVERQRALLQHILAELPGGAYLVHGPDARLALANRAAETAWGARWMVGQSMAQFLQSTGVRYYAENGQPLTLDEMLTIQIVRGDHLAPQAQIRREIIRSPDGARLPVMLTAVRLEVALLDLEGEGVTDAVRLPQSVTAGADPASAREDSEVVALLLLQDISVIQATEQLKDEFVSMAAHELRSPLAAIKGFAGLLSHQTALGKGPPLVNWQEEAIGEIMSASERLNALVQDLLDATRIQAGRMALHAAPLDLVAVARRCEIQMQSTTKNHNLTLEAPDEPVLLAADSLRLEQVLSNLLNNAIKYSPDGGSIQVVIRQNEASGEAELRVRDHGIGIPTDEQAQLFQRFARASNVHDYHIPGSGLGLYICRELVEQHGGHLWFESAEGQGTTFVLTLPLLDPADAERMVEAEEAAQAGEAVAGDGVGDRPPDSESRRAGAQPWQADPAPDNPDSPSAATVTALRRHWDNLRDVS
jgi:PAS domain S-box-containing protein